MITISLLCLAARSCMPWIRRRRARAARSPPYADRWLYCSANLQVDRSVDELIALFDRAKPQRLYRHPAMPTTSSRSSTGSPTNYFRNVEKLKAAAARARLELIPAVFSIGYSNGHLAHDPNLAEGVPVIDQPVSSSRPDPAVLVGRSGGQDQERRSRAIERRPVRRRSRFRMIRA